MQPIKKVNNKDHHFIFCLDGSGSMRDKDQTSTSRWQKVKNALKLFLDERIGNSTDNQNDIISIIVFSTQSKIIISCQHIF